MNRTLLQKISARTRHGGEELKNQYFGDINDYRKYGLLRILAGRGVSLGVCWMLTPDDGSSDGRLRSYLDDPERWQGYDSELYTSLRESVTEGRRCNISEAEVFLGSALFFREYLSDHEDRRRLYFEKMLSSFADRDLIFFDPDNGLETASVQIGKKGCSRYVYWAELESAWEAGHSLLVYQHFPRKKRGEFIKQSAGRYAAGLRAEVISIQTSRTVFFLMMQPEHTDILKSRAYEAAGRWKDQFRLSPSSPRHTERTEPAQKAARQ